MTEVGLNRELEIRRGAYISALFNAGSIKIATASDNLLN